MSFEWFVARRYLTARRKQAFISLISAVSILGVGVGVMALVIALALMTGVQGELRDRIVGSAAHVYVYKLGGAFTGDEAERQALDVPGVAGSAPAILALGLITAGGRAEPVQLKGIDPVREEAVTDIGSAIVAGSLEALSAPREPDAPDPLILGKGLADSLGLAVGDRPIVLTPQIRMTPAGPMPRMHAFEVVGIAEFGFHEIDSGAAFTTVDAAGRALNKDGADFIQLRLQDMDQAPEVADALQERLGNGYVVEDWSQLNEPLYAALWLEKVAISLTIGLIIMVAALNIVASLVLLVMEKSRDIAILRTMGASARAIRRIFIYQGLIIGLIGTLAGSAAGLTVSWIADRYRLVELSSEVYQIAYLPFRIEPVDVLIVILSAILVCLIATIHPARQAGRLDPAEALRHQ
jgi:lipoprotein-releasing system permease protein